MKEMQTRASSAKITSIFHSIKQHMLEGKLPCWSGKKKALLLCALDDLSLDGGKHVATCMLGKNVWHFRVACHVSLNQSLICEQSKCYFIF